MQTKNIHQHDFFLIIILRIVKNCTIGIRITSRNQNLNKHLLKKLSNYLLGSIKYLLELNEVSLYLHKYLLTSILTNIWTFSDSINLSRKNLFKLTFLLFLHRIKKLNVRRLIANNLYKYSYTLVTRGA